jgi:diguanylate cyclase (GGDEF)-like protein
MTTLGGILLPESTLHSGWFLVFAAFVGVNTIIYMGLTLSRLIPWPRPLHPSVVRGFLGIKPAAAAESIGARVSRETSAEAGVHDVARAFGWLGTVILLSSTTLAFLRPRNLTDYLGIGAGMLFLAVAQVLSRARTSPVRATWLWACAISALAVATALTSVSGDVERLGYLLVLTVAFGAVSLTWPSFVFAAVWLLGSYASVATGAAGPLWAAWLAPWGAAAVGAALLLVIRRRSLGILTDVERLENQLGTTDALTGVLTRQGLLTLCPSLLRAAERAGEAVFVLAIDIVDLDALNHDFGTAYGDDILRVVADAVRAASRDADLLGRWSGDEFVLAGIGGDESVAALANRVTQAVAESPVTLGKAPLRLSLGTTVGSPRDPVEALVERAMSALEQT